MTIRRVLASAVVIGALSFAAAPPAAAQVRDAVYRGTLVCSALPFLKGYLRAAMEVTVKGNAAEYSQPVINAENGTMIGMEKGKGTIEGTAIKLAGSWAGDKRGFEATYSGTFVRRSARLTGTQVWTNEGKTYRRTCSGAVKRPFAVFLKREGSR